MERLIETLEGGVKYWKKRSRNCPPNPLLMSSETASPALNSWNVRIVQSNVRCTVWQSDFEIGVTSAVDERDIGTKRAREQKYWMKLVSFFIRYTSPPVVVANNAISSYGNLTVNFFHTLAKCHFRRSENRSHEFRNSTSPHRIFDRCIVSR